MWENNSCINLKACLLTPPAGDNAEKTSMKTAKWNAVHVDKGSDNQQPRSVNPIANLGAAMLANRDEHRFLLALGIMLKRLIWKPPNGTPYT